MLRILLQRVKFAVNDVERKPRNVAGKSNILYIMLVDGSRANRERCRLQSERRLGGGLEVRCRIELVELGAARCGDSVAEGLR